MAGCVTTLSKYITYLFVCVAIAKLSYCKSYQIKTTKIDYLFQGVLYLISALCCTLAHRCFTGMGLALRLSLQPWVSWCARNLTFDEFSYYEHRFLHILSYLPELLGNFKAFRFTVRLRGKAVRL